jgi:translation elongation factor EF-Tu-like GTPase
MTEAEAIEKINALTASNKTQTDILKKVQSEIQTLLDNRPTDGQTSPAFDAALTALEESQAERNAQLAVADAMNPDAPTEPPTEPTNPPD